MSPDYSEILNIASGEYAKARVQSCPEPRPQEARRVGLLQKINTHYLYGVAFLDPDAFLTRAEYKREWNRCYNKRNRAQILLDVLQERAEKAREQIAAEELATARTPEGKAFFDECLRYASKFPLWNPNRFGRVMTDEDNPNAPANPCGTFGYYLARVAYNIVNK